MYIYIPIHIKDDKLLVSNSVYSSYVNYMSTYFYNRRTSFIKYFKVELKCN